jgi:GT2 family glycosyltransferase
MLTYPLTFIIIVNWNGKETLRKCLFSLFAHTQSSEFRVVVVDNSSTDESTEMLQKDFPKVQLITNEANMGFSFANNQGIQTALANGAKQILLLNNDIEISDSKWLEALSSVLESDPKVGIVGCKLIFPDGKIQHAGGIIALRGPCHRGEHEEDMGQYDKVEFVDYVTGAALLIRPEVITKIGVLDVGFTPLYCEDTDWCVRARLYGYKIAYTPYPTLIHHCGASAKKLGRTKNTFYYRRSLIRFFLLNFQMKDILKRIIKFETKAAMSCFIGRRRNGKLPITLRSDASQRFLLFLNSWAPSMQDLKGIMAKREQRFLLKTKLQI